MGNETKAWADEEARRLAAHVERTAGRLESLAERYVTLLRYLVPGVSGGGADELVVHKPAGPRVPLSLDVVDLRDEVALFVRDLLPRVRLAMRLRGVTRGAGDVVPGLRLMRRMLPGVYARDRELGEEITRGAWDLERRACWVMGESPRPYPLADPCGACGVASLWVVPERMLIRCGNPGCGLEAPVAVSVPVHSSVTGTARG